MRWKRSSLGGGKFVGWRLRSLPRGSANFSKEGRRFSPVTECGKCRVMRQEVKMWR